MTVYFADANIFLRYFLNDVPAQTREATKYFQQAKSGEVQIILCPMIIFEIFFVLKEGYKFSKEQIVDTLGNIINVPYLEVEEKTIFNDVLLFYLEKNLDFADCYLYVRSQSSGGKILTFDADFKKIGIPPLP